MKIHQRIFLKVLAHLFDALAWAARRKWIVKPIVIFAALLAVPLEIILRLHRPANEQAGANVEIDDRD